MLAPGFADLPHAAVFGFAFKQPVKIDGVAALTDQIDQRIVSANPPVCFQLEPAAQAIGRMCLLRLVYALEQGKATCVDKNRVDQVTVAEHASMRVPLTLDVAPVKRLTLVIA